MKFLGKNKMLIFIALVFLAIGYMLAYITYINAKDEAFSNAMTIARSSKKTLFTSLIAKLTGAPEDIDKPEYKEIKKTFMELVTVSKDIRFVYLYTKRDGKYYFMVDSEIETSEDYSPPGQEYFEAAAFDVKEDMITPPTTDRWGTWVSVLMPIKDSNTGEVTAIFAMDYDASKWNGKIAKQVIESIVIIIAVYMVIIAFYIIFLKNINLEKEKIRADAANVAKSQFLANMSHEIRTPMNGIIGFLELLNRSSLAKDQKEFIREAKSASEVLLILINDILDFSKIESGKLSVEKISFRIRTAIEDAVSLLAPKAAEKDLEIHTMIKGNVPDEILGDPGRLRQVLNNLVSNAVKFTDSGDIIVNVDCVEEGNDMVLIRFDVKDSGIGISVEDGQKLFKPFVQADASTTRKYGGTGLGLAISKELVKIMGGNISFESIEGEGTTFSFDTRAKITKRVSEDFCLEHNFLEEKLRGKNVVIVDDNTTNRKIIRLYLEGFACNIFEAIDGPNSIDLISSKASSEDKIDLAMLDFQMPGMDGFELAAKIKAMTVCKDTKLILITSVAQIGDINEIRKIGFHGYLTKPLRRDDLINCMAMVLGLKKESDDDKVITRHDIKEMQDYAKPKILLAEDNWANKKIVTTMLKEKEMSCDIAENGIEAFDAVMAKDYDIVFMDCQMPKMDGYEATKKIRAAEGENKHTRIIAMTANAMEGDRIKCIESGMDDYLSKPLSFDLVFKMIDESIQIKKEG